MMTKRKIVLFFVIALAVFGMTRGSNNLRQASASVEPHRKAQPTLGNFDAYDMQAER